MRTVEYIIWTALTCIPLQSSSKLRAFGCTDKEAAYHCKKIPGMYQCLRPDVQFLRACA